MDPITPEEATRRAENWKFSRLADNVAYILRKIDKITKTSGTKRRYHLLEKHCTEEIANELQKRGWKIQIYGRRIHPCITRNEDGTERRINKRIILYMVTW